MDTHFLPFLGLIAVLVAIPGPAVTLTMKNAMVRGGRLAFMTAVGVFTADLVWVLASIMGVTTILVASGPAFQMLKLFGAGYLIYIGIRLLVSRHEPLADPGNGTVEATSTSGSTARAFREGFICDLSNPKTLLTFTSVIPQFLPRGGSVVDTAILGVSFAVLGFISLGIYALVFTSASRAVARPRLKRALLRSSGGILVAFGIGVATQPR